MSLPFISTIPQAIGSDRVYQVQLCQPGTVTPITSFLSTDTLAASIWTGDDQPTLVSPVCAWTDAGNGILTLTVSAANTTTLALPGEYRVQVRVTASGTVVDAPIGRIKLIASPGAAASIATYCSAADLDEYLPSIDQLIAATDETGFLKQRGRARQLFEQLIVDRESTQAWWNSQTLWYRIDPPSIAPVVNPTGGGSTGGLLQAGSYFLAFTYNYFNGETAVGFESQQFTVPSGAIPQATLPSPIPLGATSANLYLTGPNGAPGSETLYLSGLTGSTVSLATAWTPGQPPPTPIDVSDPTSGYEAPNSNRDMRSNLLVRARRNALVKYYLEQNMLLLDGVTGDAIRECNAKWAASIVLLAQIGPQGQNVWEDLGRRYAKEAMEIASGIKARIDTNADGVADIVISLSDIWCC